MNQEQTKAKNDKPQWDKDFEDFGDEAVNRVKELVKEGNVRRLVIRKANNEVLLDVPLMPAIVAGSIMTLWVPFLTVLGVIAAFVAKLKLDIVHIEAANESTESIEIAP